MPAPTKIAAAGFERFWYDDHTAGQDEGPTGSPIGTPTTMVYADELSG